MAVPKRRTTPTRRGNRRSHHALTRPGWVTCPSCAEPKQRHRACPSCGIYKGREVIKIVEKT